MILWVSGRLWRAQAGRAQVNFAWKVGKHPNSKPVSGKVRSCGYVAVVKDGFVKDEIRILVLEDVPADVVMINHELRKARLNFRCKRVETKDEFLQQLKNHSPDVILSDHGL